MTGQFVFQLTAVILHFYWSAGQVDAGLAIAHQAEKLANGGHGFGNGDFEFLGFERKRLLGARIKEPNVLEFS